MNELFLLRICRIQEITKFFTDLGFTREYVHKKIIRPHFFIGRTTYYKYLKSRAEIELQQKYAIDYDAYKQAEPVNYMNLMEQFKDKDILTLGFIKDVKS